MKKLITSLALFIKFPHKEELPFNLPHKPLMKPIPSGLPTENKSHLPVTGMEISTCSSCLPTEVSPGD